MGQQAATSVGACVTRNKFDPEGDRQQLIASLQRVEKLLLDPETLARECDAHFRRAGLDAHGAMRRVELRRLLYTFSHSLGSTKLTWESIEAAAVIGTLDAEIPVVTQEEFFRCVTKTVHLVAAELRQKLQEVDMSLRPPPRRPPQRQELQPPSSLPSRPPHPWAALAEQKGNGLASPASSYCSSREVSEEEAEEIDARPMMQPQQAPVIFRPSPCEAVAMATDPEESRSQFKANFFTPAPDGADPEEVVAATASINGILVLVLSNEGTFDPHRLYVSHGIMVLCPPDEQSPPNFEHQLQGVAEGRTAFDLSALETAIRGAAITQTPAADLIPGFATKSRECIDRMLVLGYDEGQALCLWFQEMEHCNHCAGAILAEAVAQGAHPLSRGMPE
eukprot:TRINITY_DN76398_c0_g1_i1.p1 TRINITY_DN76398_c0_g1~~TRINITY_DN76398_c0_g1_i1.p1  ORF type:complete len:411 (+),score=82.71 TRINITY_DN76398_c0_g1_i1:60-1235(+)